MKTITFEELSNHNAPWRCVDNRWATDAEITEARRLSAGMDAPTAYLSDDGALLVNANCHGGAGRFPLVCMDGMEAFWDSEVKGPGGKIEIPHTTTGYSVFPFQACAEDSGALNRMGQSLYGGWYAVRWHITRFAQ